MEAPEVTEAENAGMAHFPPGEAAPTAEQKLAARLAKMNEGKAAFYALPLEKRQEIIADRKAKKLQRRQEREAKRAAKTARRNGTEPPATTPADTAPATVPSRRDPAPDLDIPRRGSQALTGLIDLCGALPNLGDGSCFIQVTRLKPPSAWNIPTAGVQKPIWDVIDDAEFALAYGGAEYSLRGYVLREGGKARALTEPITYKVAGAPNLDSALTEDDTMIRNQPPVPNGHPGYRRPPGVVTPQAAAAEATIHSRSLDHEERVMDRQDERRRRERAETAEREQQRRDSELETARLIDASKEKEMERLERQHQRELELAQNRGDGSAALVEVLKAFRPGEDAQGLVRQHATEIRQLTESHKEELIRITSDHRGELQRLTESHNNALRRVEDQARADRERADNLVRDAEKRAADAVKEAERRASDQIRATEQRADQRVSEAQNQGRTSYEEIRTRGEERLRDQNQQWQQRFDDLKANHDREMRQKDSEINLMRSNLEGNQAVILAAKDTEIKRLQHDLREWKETAEKNKDWLGKMGEFEKTAEALGFEKGGGEENADEDLKTTVIKAGLGVAQRLPELVQAAGEAIGKVRNPGVPPDLARGQARGGMVRDSMRTIPRALGTPAPVHMAPLAFATEDGGYVPPAEQPPPRPLVPPMPGQPTPLPPLEQSPSVALAGQQQMLPLPEPPPPQPQPPPAPQPAPEQQVAPEPAPVAVAPAVAPPEPAPAPTAMPAPIPAPQAPAQNEADEAVAFIVQRFTPMLAMQFEQKVPASQVAQQIITDNGVETARMAIGLVTAEQLIRIIIQNPGQYSVLATRNGQKFLRDIWSAAEKLVAE